MRISMVSIIIIGLSVTLFILLNSRYDSFTSIFGVNNVNKKLDTKALSKMNMPIIMDEYQEIKMEVKNEGWSIKQFILKKGLPVKWMINGLEINSCNNRIEVPDLNLDILIKEGLQVIEFIPDKEGNVPWSCAEGHLPGLFIVRNHIHIEDLEKQIEEIEKEINYDSLFKGQRCTVDSIEQESSCGEGN